MTVGPLEGAILDVLWAEGKMTGVPAVHQALTDSGRSISYSAVKAVLNNLEQKGWLRKELRGKVTHFEPVKTREEFDSGIVTEVIKSLKRNYGRPVIAQFVDELAVDESTIEEFERLIEARKKELGQ